jgi:hypothetical protein
VVIRQHPGPGWRASDLPKYSHAIDEGSAAIHGRLLAEAPRYSVSATNFPQQNGNTAQLNNKASTGSGFASKLWRMTGRLSDISRLFWN